MPQLEFFDEHCICHNYFLATVVARCIAWNPRLISRIREKTVFAVSIQSYQAKHWDFGNGAKWYSSSWEKFIFLKLCFFVYGLLTALLLSQFWCFSFVRDREINIQYVKPDMTSFYVISGTAIRSRVVDLKKSTVLIIIIIIIIIIIK